MDFDFTTLPPDDRYRLLTNFVGPRPIALVTTLAEDGSTNAAPMSFFNVFSHDPAILALGIQPRLDGRQKDTVANIRRTGDFVVHVVERDLAQPMLVCGLGVEPGVDELKLAGLEAVRALREAGMTPRRPIEVVAWTNEEGGRYAPGCMGSMAYTGFAPPQTWDGVTDRAGAPRRS